MKNQSIKFILVLILNLILNPYLSATNLEITNIRPVLRNNIDPAQTSVIFDISWDNAWNNDKNHDAAWVFMKFNRGGHVKLLPSGHKVLQNRVEGAPSARIELSEDKLGFFIYPTRAYRGRVDYKLQVYLDTKNQKVDNRKMTNNFQVLGVEMVYIPQGAFTLGSPDEAAEEHAAFYRSDAEGKPDGLINISSEAAIEVGPEAGKLYYWSETALYNGDQKGPIPADFPKGFDAFYIMKYELTQGQYAAFLNSIPDNDTYIRSPLGGRDYHKKRGGIRFKNGKYQADNPHRPMNYVSFTDGLAYSDWAALRPITELEYEKAARGTAAPKANEFVWGTDNYDQLARYVNDHHELVTDGWEESQLDDAHRAVFGASYYWVMDLSGSVWEKVITVGNPIGRQFTGSHGDGELDFGKATNPDWPQSDDEEGGFGYRGGGYYAPGTYYSEYNPHSPTGYRYYGAWSGGPRYISYGYRAGRSADE